jgi:hypothetical protein
MTHADLHIVQAFQTVHEILDMKPQQSPEMQRAIAASGVDPIWTTFRWSDHSGVEFIQDIRRCFNLKVSVSIRFVPTRDPGERAQVSVTWPSGGGDVAQAMAELSYQMAWAQKAAQVEVVLRELARRFKTHEDLVRAMSACLAEHEKAWAAVKAAMAD